MFTVSRKGFRNVGNDSCWWYTLVPMAESNRLPAARPKTLVLIVGYALGAFSDRRSVDPRVSASRLSMLK